MIRKGTRVEYCGAYGVAVRPVGSRGVVLNFDRRCRSVTVEWDNGREKGPRPHWIEAVQRVQNSPR